MDHCILYYYQFFFFFSILFDVPSYVHRYVNTLLAGVIQSGTTIDPIGYMDKPSYNVTYSASYYNNITSVEVTYSPMPGSEMSVINIYPISFIGLYMRTLFTYLHIATLI